MWSEATNLKRDQLESEISQIANPTHRANMLHTLSKLMMFAEEDVNLVRHREALARYVQELLGERIRHIFSKGFLNRDGSIMIPREYYTYLNQLMETPYHILSETDKESARYEADKIIATLQGRTVIE